MAMMKTRSQTSLIHSIDEETQRIPKEDNYLHMVVDG